MQQITANVKIFISQPVNGLSFDEIRKAYEYYTEKLKNKFPNAELISALNDTYKDEEKEVNRIECLGRSITAMSEADFVTFLPGWTTADGCLVERNVADRYGIMVIKPIDYLSQTELNEYYAKDREIEEAYCKRNNVNRYSKNSIPVPKYDRCEYDGRD